MKTQQKTHSHNSAPMRLPHPRGDPDICGERSPAVQPCRTLVCGTRNARLLHASRESPEVIPGGVCEGSGPEFHLQFNQSVQCPQQPALHLQTSRSAGLHLESSALEAQRCPKARFSAHSKPLHIRAQPARASRTETALRPRNRCLRHPSAGKRAVWRALFGTGGGDTVPLSGPGT